MSFQICMSFLLAVEHRRRYLKNVRISQKCINFQADELSLSSNNEWTPLVNRLNQSNKLLREFVIVKNLYKTQNVLMDWYQCHEYSMKVNENWNIQKGQKKLKNYTKTKVAKKEHSSHVHYTHFAALPKMIRKLQFQSIHHRKLSRGFTKQKMHSKFFFVSL